jgi:hypothetical protein
MSGPLLAEFGDADGLLRAARRISRDGHHMIDALTPFPLPELDEVLDIKPSRIRIAMLIAGFGMAAFGYWLQWYSAVIDYPLNVGGRPLNSWPVFLIVPFEVGMLAAAIAGFVAFLVSCGLPSLHHPVFDVTGIERATQDRFFLLAEQAKAGPPNNLRHLLEHLGALTVTEVRP